MAQALYLDDTYLFEANSKVIGYGSDEKGDYVLLQETIFYPQGGGQPSDHGLIIINDKDVKISFVRQIDSEIRHYVEGSENLRNTLHNKVTCRISQDRRILNARYHTAAHLLGNIAETIYPDMKAVKGHSFPGEAYVEFIGDAVIDESVLTKEINAAIVKNFSTSTFEILPEEFADKFYKLPYPVPAHKTFRAMQIHNFAPVPCGGTHVKSTAEIGEFKIRKVSKKDGRIKISYNLG